MDKNIVLGVGVDIVQIKRIERILEHNPKRFLDKVFTEREKEYFRQKTFNAQTIAGFFSIKEAASKALGTGFKGIGFKDLEIIKEECGKPILILHGNAKFIFNEKGFNVASISISHEKEYAMGFVVFM